MKCPVGIQQCVSYNKHIKAYLYIYILFFVKIKHKCISLFCTTILYIPRDLDFYHIPDAPDVITSYWASIPFDNPYLDSH